MSRHATLSRRAVQCKLSVAGEQSAHERAADRAAADVLRAGSNGSQSPGVEHLRARHSVAEEDFGIQSVELPADAGRSLTAGTRRFAERAFGEDFSRVRVHTGAPAERAAAKLGARAFTHGNNIWLGRHESESDRPLIAHELAHVVQQRAGVVSLRSATWLERRAWLSFFSHPVPRRLLDNYMDDTGTAVVLSQAEMIGCNPVVDIRHSAGFVAEVRSRAAGGTGNFAVSGWGGALTNGTLGNFTINYAGPLTVTPAGGWSFAGMMNFYDYWDFDPKPFNSGSGRPATAEVKVRVAAAALPGRPFSITSVSVPVSQSSGDSKATWAGGSPTPVSGPATRSAVDIGTGGAAGDVGGPDVEAAGGETGAQASEDLN
ncbi:MAG: DUF4157 domain-containing protein [Acidobacteriota bacterium]